MRDRFLDGFGAALEPLPFLVGHLWFEHLGDAAASENAGQRECDAVLRAVGADGDDNSFIVQHNRARPHA